MACRILQCTCKHKFQDKEHGKQMRVHNPMGEDKYFKWRCTVCKSEKK